MHNSSWFIIKYQICILLTRNEIIQFSGFPADYKKDNDKNLKKFAIKSKKSKMIRSYTVCNKSITHYILPTNLRCDT